MKIKKYELEELIRYIHELKLDRNDSRMRTRFKKILIDRYTEFAEDLNEINEHYAVKDNEGKIVFSSDDKVTFENNDERLKEIYELSMEIIEVEQNEENKKMLLSVKDSVINRGPTELTGKDADLYDNICEIMEQINYE